MWCYSNTNMFAYSCGLARWTLSISVYRPPLATKPLRVPASSTAPSTTTQMQDARSGDDAARAMAIRWRWPPDNSSPLFPTSVSSLSSSEATTSPSSAARTAACRSYSGLAAGWGHGRRMFSRIMHEKNVISWVARVMCLRRAPSCRVRTSVPSWLAVPPCWSQNAR